MTAERNKGGRPRDGAEVKRAPLNLTTTPELAARVAEYAAARRLTRTRAVEELVLKGLAGVDDTGTIHRP